MEQGVARRRLPRSELESEIREMIERPKRYLSLALGTLVRELPDSDNTY